MAEDRGRAGEQDGQTGSSSALLTHLKTLHVIPAANSFTSDDSSYTPDVVHLIHNVKLSLIPAGRQPSAEVFH